jgi:glycosyltransferase involved in cell wall biosynthesis
LSAVTFACGTPHGGAVDSTVALASCAIEAGHDVVVVVASGDAYSTHPRLQSLLVRLTRINTRLGCAAWALYDRFAARARPDSIGGIAILRAADVPAAVSRRLRSGETLVVNSVRGIDLARLLRMSHRQSCRFVWYLREASALAHVAEYGGAVDVLLANAVPLATEAERLAERPCPYVPSVISRDGLVEPAVRRSVLLVNAVASYGLEEAIAIAAAMPEDLVVLQESWPLEDGERSRLLARLSKMKAVEFRARAPRSEVFRDARLMIAPHSPEVVGVNRPRVLVEAQVLGVPVIAHDVPGLASVVPSPELLIPVGADVEAWVAAIRLVDRDYARFEAQAREFAARELLTPGEVWVRFVEACGGHI